MSLPTEHQLTANACEAFRLTATLIATAVLMLSLTVPKALACDDARGPFLDAVSEMAGSCSSHLCGRIHRAAPPASSCGLLDAVGKSLDAGGVLLLGEVHDNAHHHALRAALLDDILSSADPRRRGQVMPLVFEHIREDQTPALNRFRDFAAASGASTAAADLFRFLEWDKSGWPDEKLFEPLFAAAIQFKLPILPGDPPREKVRAVAKGGAAALTEDERQRLHLDQPLAAPLQDALLTELEASHCGLMPKTAFGNMAVAQRYRDAHLAEALVKAADAHGSAVLFAGNGHVGNDRGVPYYLKQMAPNRKVVTVMLLEVEDGKTDPEAYVPRDPEGKPAADYIIFTPRAERTDPCADMRERFGKKK